MPDETALNDNTEKRLYHLSASFSLLSVHYQLISALWPCLSPHNPVLSARYFSLSPRNLVLSTRYLFIPHICPAFHHTTSSFPRITYSFQHFPPPFHHTTSYFPHIPLHSTHFPPSLSPHNLLLSAHLILLSTAVIDVARLILPPVLPFPKEKAVS